MILCDDLQFIYHKMTYPFIWKKGLSVNTDF